MTERSVPRSGMPTDFAISAALCSLRTEKKVQVAVIGFVDIPLFDLAASLRPDLSEGQRRQAQARSRLAAGHRRRRRGAALTGPSLGPGLRCREEGAEPSCVGPQALAE